MEREPNSRKFDITYNGMTLEIEFYTKEYILKKFNGLNGISSVKCVSISQNSPAFSE